MMGFWQNESKVEKMYPRFNVSSAVLFRVNYAAIISLTEVFDFYSTILCNPSKPLEATSCKRKMTRFFVPQEHLFSYSVLAYYVNHCLVLFRTDLLQN